jgi:hypothetical protein
LEKKASRSRGRTPKPRGGPRRRAAAAAAPADGVTLVYIHGIGAQPPADQLEASWNEALFGGPAPVLVRTAYWADIRHPSASRVRALSRRGELLLEADDVPEDVPLTELLAQAGVPAAARSRAERFARQLGAAFGESLDVRPTQEGVGARALPLPRWAREGITRGLTRLFIRDTAAYFFDRGQRGEMQKRLSDVLAEISGPVVLVAHSQGTIIAYDVLSALGAKARVAHLVTLGSPLGIQEVQDQIAKPLRVPAGVTAWSNFADTLDPVALDKGLATDFAPRDTIRDQLVANTERPRWGFHSAVGYLAAQPVRSVVQNAVGGLRSLGLGRLIRKDVVAAMADRWSRHPLLIELNDEQAFQEAFPGSARGDEEPPPPLDERRRTVAAAVRQLVKASGADPDRDGRVDPLHRFVGAHLTAPEIEALVREQRVHIYCVWRSSRKRKLVRRSADVIHAPPARLAYRAQGEGITWAVLDTGVYARHAHFALHRNVDQVWDCTRTGAPRRLRLDDARDRDGHGTHVAGILAGSDGEAQPRYAGIAPKAKLRVYKVLDDEGDGEDAWIIKALDHIAEVNNRASGLAIHGVNLSLGGGFDAEAYGCGHSPICQELRRLWRQGVVVCVACGNAGQIEVRSREGYVDLNTMLSVDDPANLEECIAVGSVNADRPHVYGISHFSSRGPTADGRLKPDVVAPGERIESCDSSTADGYVAMDGTSMACPHVSGLVAAFLSARREFVGRPDDVKRILRAHCTDIGRDRYHQGAGIPNLMKMLENT